MFKKLLSIACISNREHFMRWWSNNRMPVVANIFGVPIHDVGIVCFNPYGMECFDVLSKTFRVAKTVMNRIDLLQSKHCANPFICQIAKNIHCRFTHYRDWVIKQNAQMGLKRIEQLHEQPQLRFTRSHMYHRVKNVIREGIRRRIRKHYSCDISVPLLCGAGRGHFPLHIQRGEMRVAIALKTTNMELRTFGSF